VCAPRETNLRQMDDQLRRRAVGAPAARSLLLTILGEYVLPAPDGVWHETLIGALGTLEVKTQAARQALARSISAGWLRSERSGRRSRARLTDGTAEMLRTGARRIYSFGQPWQWEGRWLLVTLRVPEQRRDVRHQLRTQLAWAGFGSLGGGVWISPHVEREPELLSMSGNGSVAELLSFHAELGALGDPTRLIADAWNLERVAAAYKQFIADFGRQRPRTPAAVFRAQTLLVHEWRKFPFLDPDLPERLLPARWPRSRAHALFEDRHGAWHEIAQDYFASIEASAAAGRDGSSKLSRIASK
jgi:phenylacetic acid degradation operon negative regulatory protein